MNSRALLVVLLLASSPSRAESFKAWAARAAREEREKNDDAAFQSYSNALTSWKDSDGSLAKGKVFCARAALRDKRGDEEGALDDYSECVALDKKNPKAFHRRGQLRFKAGKTALAIDDFYKAVALDIGYAQAYADRAQAYEKQGDKQFAGEDYRHACALGIKAACPKAQKLAPARASAPKKKHPAAPPAAPSLSTAPSSGAADAPAAPAPAARPAPRAPYRPRFSDCLDALQACADEGTAYGACVDKAERCGKTPTKGCCPAACVRTYRKSVDDGASEAAAYRKIFVPGASCAAH